MIKNTGKIRLDLIFFSTPLHLWNVSKNVMKRPPNEGGEWGQGGHDPPTFSEIVICHWCFPGNLLLCHSLRHPELFWPRHSQNLVGGADERIFETFKIFLMYCKLVFNPFNASDIFLHPLTTSDNQRFFDLFKAYRKYWKKLVAWNGLKNSIRFSHFTGFFHFNSLITDLLAKIFPTQIKLLKVHYCRF